MAAIGDAHCVRKHNPQVSKGDMRGVLILHSSLPMTVYFSSSFLHRQKATLLNCVSVWIFLHDVVQSPLPVKHDMHIFQISNYSIIFFCKISWCQRNDEWQSSE